MAFRINHPLYGFEANRFFTEKVVKNQSLEIQSKPKIHFYL